MIPRPKVDLRHLRSFVVLARELHYGRAAVILGIAQPPLSQQIQHLEKVIGHRLFERSTRMVRLTDAGHELVKVSNQLLEDTERGLETVQQVGRGERGSLTIGFTPTMPFVSLPAIVRAYRVRLPDVRLHLSEFMPDAMLEALEAQRIDIGLHRDPAAAPSVVVTPVRTESFVAALPEHHRLAKSTGLLQLEELSGDDFVLTARAGSSGYFERLMQVFQEARFSPRVVQEVSNLVVGVSLVGAGIGVSVMTTCVRSLRIPGIVYRTIKTPIRSTIVLTKRRSDERELVSSFFEIAKEAERSG